MKLRNKKTGEIAVIRETIHLTKENDICCGMGSYNSLAELNEDWEDVEEEPKGYWFIDCAAPYSVDFCEFNEDTEDDKQIGNYFSSREEAELAVRKLKAWKKLKDKGISFFNNKIIGEYGNVSYTLTYPVTTIEEKQLDLLFGGEE